jgi:hypothetical protein
MKNPIFFLLLFSMTAKAQGRFNHQFDLDYPFELFTSVLPTDSCFYVTGLVTDTTEGYFRIGNIFLKLNLNGEIQFEKKLSSVEKYYETWYGDLINTPDGGFLDIGISRDSTNKILLLKYDKNGDTIFTREFLHPLYPEESFLYTAEILREYNGNIWILSGIDVDPGIANGDIYLIKLDSTGHLRDSFIYGIPAAQDPMTMLFDGPEIVIGSRKTNYSQVSQNFFSRTHIFGIDTAGQILWEYQSPSGQLFSTADDMITTPDGGLVIASGKGIEHVVNAETGQLRWFPYIFKLDENHNFKWGIELRGTRQSIGSSLRKIVTAADGSGYVGVGRIGEDVTLGEEIYGSWVVKVSPEGDSLWARYYSVFDSTIVEPRPYDLKNTPDGGYVLVGDTSPELPGITVQRAWIMKLDEHGCLIPGCEAGDTVSTTTLQPVDVPVQLAIYPNPTSDYLNFQLRTARPVQEATFRILDAQGRVLREFQSNHLQDTFIVPVEGWAAGVYFLEASEKGVVLGVERFVVK